MTMVRWQGRRPGCAEHAGLAGSSLVIALNTVRNIRIFLTAWRLYNAKADGTDSGAFGGFA
jgi:hypothetical protein